MKQIELKGGIDAPVKTTSEAWSLPKARELIQGAISAGVSSALGVLLPSIEGGEFIFNWKIVLGAGITGFLTYILRKLPQSQKVIVDVKEYEEAKK